jgi:hypothetical protein
MYTHRYEVFIGLLESYGFQQAVTRYGSPAFYHEVRNDVFGSLGHFRYISMILILSFFCKYQHKTALPQIPVVASGDDGTATT